MLPSYCAFTPNIALTCVNYRVHRQNRSRTTTSSCFHGYCCCLIYGLKSISLPHISLKRKKRGKKNLVKMLLPPWRGVHDWNVFFHPRRSGERGGGRSVAGNDRRGRDTAEVHLTCFAVRKPFLKGDEDGFSSINLFIRK